MGLLLDLLWYGPLYLFLPITTPFLRTCPFVRTLRLCIWIERLGRLVLALVPGAALVALHSRLDAASTNPLTVLPLLLVDALLAGLVLKWTWDARWPLQNERFKRLIDFQVGLKQKQRALTPAEQARVTKCKTNQDDARAKGRSRPWEISFACLRQLIAGPTGSATRAVDADAVAMPISLLIAALTSLVLLAVLALLYWFVSDAWPSGLRSSALHIALRLQAPVTVGVLVLWLWGMGTILLGCLLWLPIRQWLLHP